MSIFEEACELMKKQLGYDVVLALGTSIGNNISTRNVDGYYKAGAIYVVTHESTLKMKQVAINPKVAFCKSYDPAKPYHEALLEGMGTGENLGNPKEHEMRNELREVFIGFYDRHVNEDDPKTCILKINVTNVVIFDGRYKYSIDYINKTAEKFHCKI